MENNKTLKAIGMIQGALDLLSEDRNPGKESGMGSAPMEGHDGFKADFRADEDSKKKLGLFKLRKMLQNREDD